MCASITCPAVWFLVHTDEFKFHLPVDDANQGVITFMVVRLRKTGPHVLVVVLFCQVVWHPPCENLWNPRMVCNTEQAVPWLMCSCDAVSSVVVLSVRILALVLASHQQLMLMTVPNAWHQLHLPDYFLTFLSTHTHFSMTMRCAPTQCVSTCKFQHLYTYCPQKSYDIFCPDLVQINPQITEQKSSYLYGTGYIW